MNDYDIERENQALGTPTPGGDDTRDQWRVRAAARQLLLFSPHGELAELLRAIDSTDGGRVTREISRILSILGYDESR